MALLQDDCWVRATLVRRMSRSQLALSLVDSGRLVLRPESDLRLLLPQFRELPAQAVRVRLAGVRPMGEGGWGEGAISWFRWEIGGNSYVGLVDDIQEEEGEAVMTIELIDTSDENTDINISQEMIRRSLARAADTSS